MPESSIADEISRLSACRDGILSAISSKGVDVPPGSTFSSCPGLIASIAGSAPEMANTAFTGSGVATYSRPFTASQVYGPRYVTVSSAFTTTFSTSTNGYRVKLKNGGTSWFPLDGTDAELVFSGKKESYDEIPRYGNLYRDSVFIGEWTSTALSTSFTASAKFNVSGVTASDSWLVYRDIPYYGVTGSGKVTGTKKVESGSSYPYPGYSLTSTGEMYCSSTGTAYWSSDASGIFRPVVSGTSQFGATYADGPSSVSGSGFNQMALQAGFGGQSSLMSRLTGSTVTSVEASGYTYEYGDTESSYSGYTGV